MQKALSCVKVIVQNSTIGCLEATMNTFPQIASIYQNTIQMNKLLTAVTSEGDDKATDIYLSSGRGMSNEAETHHLMRSCWCLSRSAKQNSFPISMHTSTRRLVLSGRWRIGREVFLACNAAQTTAATAREPQLQGLKKIFWLCFLVSEETSTEENLRSKYQILVQDKNHTTTITIKEGMKMWKQRAKMWWAWLHIKSIFEITKPEQRDFRQQECCNRVWRTCLSMVWQERLSYWLRCCFHYNRDIDFPPKPSHHFWCATPDTDKKVPLACCIWCHKEYLIYLGPSQKSPASPKGGKDSRLALAACTLVWTAF